MRKRIKEENRMQRKKLRTKVSKMPLDIKFTTSCRYIDAKFRRTRTYGEA